MWRMSVDDRSDDDDEDDDNGNTDDEDYFGAEDKILVWSKVRVGIEYIFNVY